MHVVVALPDDWAAAVTIPHDRVRVSFAVPWEGMLLLGTTDELHVGAPEDVEVRDADVAQVLAEAAVAIEGIGPARAAFCGLRVLPGGESSTADARRGTVISVGPAGMVSVAGGKLTTYPRIALDVLAAAGVRAIDSRPRPLPGAAGLDGIRWPAAAEAATRRHLLRLYGSLAAVVLAPAAEDASLLEPLVPGRPDVRAQELYAYASEWACTDDDVRRRRTTAWLAGAAATSRRLS